MMMMVKKMMTMKMGIRKMMKMRILPVSRDDLFLWQAPMLSATGAVSHVQFSPTWNHHDDQDDDHDDDDDDVDDDDDDDDKTIRNVKSRRTLIYFEEV